MINAFIRCASNACGQGRARPTPGMVRPAVPAGARQADGTHHRADEPWLSDSDPAAAPHHSLAAAVQQTAVLRNSSASLRASTQQPVTAQLVHELFVITT